MKSPEQIYLALGSNLGDRLGNLQQAVVQLSNKVLITRQSDIFETPPWGVTDQPLFLNQVIEGRTLLTPHALLDFLKGIETTLGRLETARFGPRVLDLDILLYGRRRIASKKLQVPHPRMHERAFVLFPLSQLEPNLVIPGIRKPVKDLLVGLNIKGITRFELEDRLTG